MAKEPGKGKEDNNKLLDPEKDPNQSIYAASSQSEEVESNKTQEPWDEDKYVWDRDELEAINKKRDKDEVLPKILRNPESHFGIRSNENLTPWMCFKSIFVPWQNEFLCIWIYFLFACYFWYQLFCLSVPTKQYDFNNKEDYEYMFVASIGICVSVTMTFFYLIFYSIDQKTYEILETLNYMGILVMLFTYSFAFYCSEFVQEEVTARFYVFFLTIVTGIGCLVLLQYDFGRVLSTCIAGVFLGVLFALDFLFMSNKRQTNIFYVPLIVESLFLGAGIFVAYYNIPERWFKKNKFVNLYVNSHIIFALILLNVIYEMHNVLYLTLKLNSNYIGELENAWYQVDNVYNTPN